MDLLWTQQLLNAWDATINVWLAVQIILEIAHHAIQDGLSTDLMFQEFLHVKNVRPSTVVNAIQLITVQNAKTFTSVNQKLPVNLAFPTVEFAKILHLVNNVSVDTFWLKLTTLNLAFYAQVDVPLVQALSIVLNATQVTLWTTVQKFVKNVLQTVGNASHQQTAHDASWVTNCSIVPAFLTLKIVLWWTLITHASNVLRVIYSVIETLDV